MDLISKDQAQKLDSLTINSGHASSIELMNNAGIKISEFIQKKYSDKKIVIISGKGNNGGDGLAAALSLKKSGLKPLVLSIFQKKDLSFDSLYFYEECKKIDIEISHPIEPFELDRSDIVIVDCILGIGLKGELRKNIQIWTEWINGFKFIISADIPTGVQADNGKVSKNAINASCTISMGMPKLGSVIEPGRSFSGAIIEVDIGFSNAMKIEGINWELLGHSKIRALLPKIDPSTHKYKQGKVLVLAGSRGMTGAAYLCSIASLRVGAGLVMSCAPKSLNDIYEKKITEAMTLPCDDKGKGYFILSNYDQIFDYSHQCDSVLIGPGIGYNKSTLDLVEKLIATITKPILIDADGLKPFFNNISLFSKIKSDFAITPHMGELSNLIDASTEDIINNFPNSIDAFMENLNGTLVAKYPSTFILKDNNGYINCSGNAGLATAGTGDVLSGMIAGLMAQGCSSLHASLIGVFIHGSIADVISKTMSKRGIIASDLLNHIPKELKEYEL